MSRTRNADEFRTAFQRARADYDRIFRRQLDEARALYDRLPAEKRPPEFDESLEHHARCYLINALLAALNWRLDLSLEDGLPNLLPEAAVRSEASGRRRFLDYLGIEHVTNNPLLIVETKRPSSPLPVLASPPDIPMSGPGTSPLQGAIPVADTDAVVISRGLASEPLSGVWAQWIRDLRDYVRSVKAETGQVPKRAVITNGYWLILFLRPVEAFIDQRRCDPRTILVFRTPEQIFEESGLLFAQLEHQRVLGEAPTLRPVELPFYVEPCQIQEAMHGLRLRYEQAKGIYQREPMVFIAPVLFLRTDLGAWLRVEPTAVQYSIPHERDQLQAHLETVRTAAQSLLAEVCDTLRINLYPSSLEKHFGDPDSFDAQNARYQVTRRSVLGRNGRPDALPYAGTVSAQLSAPRLCEQSRIGCCRPAGSDSPAKRRPAFVLLFSGISSLRSSERGSRQVPTGHAGEPRALRSAERSRRRSILRDMEL